MLADGMRRGAAHTKAHLWRRIIAMRKRRRLAIKCGVVAAYQALIGWRESNGGGWHQW